MGALGCEHAGTPSARRGADSTLASSHAHAGRGGRDVATPPASRPADRGPTGITRPHGVAARADAFCFTEGRAEALSTGLMRIREPKARAVLPRSNGDFGRLAFHYHGETSAFSALRSGARRRQLGLKLRARDACNLIYVMWRLEPQPKLVVSFKNNPNASTSRECGNDGYSNLRPREGGDLPALLPDTDHTLDADIVGNELIVRADSTVVWRGELPSPALALSGPTGFRSDNVDWTVREFEIVSGTSPFGVARCGPPPQSVAPTADSGASSASGSPRE